VGKGRGKGRGEMQKKGKKGRDGRKHSLKKEICGYGLDVHGFETL